LPLVTMIESAVLVHAPYNIEVCFCFVSQVEPSFTKQRDVSLSLSFGMWQRREAIVSLFSGHGNTPFPHSRKETWTEAYLQHIMIEKKIRFPLKWCWRSI